MNQSACHTYDLHEVSYFYKSHLSLFNTDAPCLTSLVTFFPQFFVGLLNQLLMLVSFYVLLSARLLRLTLWGTDESEQQTEVIVEPLNVFGVL